MYLGKIDILIHGELPTSAYFGIAHIRYIGKRASDTYITFIDKLVCT